MVLQPEAIATLVDRIERADIQPLVDQTCPRARIADAQASCQTKSHIGKIVLSLEDADGNGIGT